MLIFKLVKCRSNVIEEKSVLYDHTFCDSRRPQAQQHPHALGSNNVSLPSILRAFSPTRKCAQYLSQPATKNKLRYNFTLFNDTMQSLTRENNFRMISSGLKILKKTKKNNAQTSISMFSSRYNRATQSYKLRTPPQTADREQTLTLVWSRTSALTWALRNKADFQYLGNRSK